MWRRQHDVRVGSGRPEMHNEGSTLCRRDVRPNSTALFCTTARGIRAPSPIMQEFVWGICVEFRKTSTSTTKETSKSRKISVTEEPYHFRSRTEIISCRESQRSAAATRHRGWRVVGCAKIRPSWRYSSEGFRRRPLCAPEFPARARRRVTRTERSRL